MRAGSYEVEWSRGVAARQTCLLLLGALSMACGRVGYQPVDSPDVRSALDAMADVPHDAPTGIDSPVGDVPGLDAHPDVSEDVGRPSLDARAIDAGLDAAMDSGLDAPVDTGVDAPTDAGVDAPRPTPTIDFDDLVASTCVYGSAPPLDAQYAARGVTFSGDLTTFPRVVPTSCLTISGGSPPNFVGLSGAGQYLRADFTVPVRTVSLLVGNYNRIETFTLTAYDGADVMLNATVYSPPFRQFGLMSVTTTSDVAYVILTATRSENAIDDFTFTPM